MNIHGFNKTTLLDYPEHVAATVFTGGCNFRCPFCHNAGLVVDTAAQQVIAEEEVLAYLKKRRGILEGVCITGGEPTLQPDLLKFIKKVKELGYLVKLDTNGYRPDVLRSLMYTGLLDYVAMDVKASKGNYAKAAGLEQVDLVRIEESIAMIKDSGIPYEFRTTVVKGIHAVEEFAKIGQWLAGSRAYFLQAYRENENVLAYRENEREGLCSGVTDSVLVGTAGFSAFSMEEMEQMASLARKYIARVELRGVE